VYRAVQVSLDREVALKVLAADLAADTSVRDRFLQESTLAASLEHPNIVPIYDAGETDGICYIAMRYVSGSDLLAMIGRERRLSASASVAILQQLAGALQAAHDVRLIHRDVKPSNVLVEDRSSQVDVHAWLGDFGLSKRAGETTVSPTERPLGTVHYMAPEQIRGQRLDARADIYSLGCLLYQCLTGHVPFPRDSDVAVLYAHLEATPPSLHQHAPDLPEALDEVVAAALAKSAADRPGTALELAHAATAALEGRPIAPQIRPAARVPAAADDAPRARRRRLVGRLVESEQLSAALEDAASGEGGAVLLAGEPGIGKTTLARGLSEAAERRGVSVVWGVGLSAEAAPPYWHWLQVVRAIAGWPDGEQLLRSVGGRAAWLQMIVPDLETGASPVEMRGVEEGRFHIYDALLALLTAAAERSGLVVVLDDLHAADEASLLALSFIAHAIGDKKILIVGTHRDVGLPSVARTARQISELVGPIVSIEVQGLGADDVGELIELRRRVSPSAAAVDRIHAVTAGNPLFITEILSLLEADQLRDESALLSSALPLPAGVRDAITARLEPLSPRGRGMLDVASVIGERFRAATVSAAMPISGLELLELLDQAVQLRLVRPLADPPDGYAFRHGMIQATLYDALPQARRAALHRSVGEALEQAYDVSSGEGLAEVALHFLQAAPIHDPARAVAYAQRAGDRAVEKFAYDQAVSLYARALTLSTNGERRQALLQSLGEAQTRAGDTDGARATLKAGAELALAHGDAAGLARATLAMGIWGLTAGYDAELVRLAELSVQWLERTDEAGLLARAKGFLASALHWSDQLERRRLLADEALALARAIHGRAGTRESAETLGYVLGRYLLARWGPGSGRHDFAISEELVTLSQELGDSELELLARNWRVSVLLELGRFAVVDQEIARVEQMATELRQPRAMVFLSLQHALRAAGAGRFAEAERHNAESVEIAQRVHGSVGELAGAAQLVMLRLQQGRLAELEPALRAMITAHPEMVGFHCAHAAALLQASPGEAREQLESLTARGIQGFPQDSSHVIMLVLIGEVATELSDQARSAQIYEWLLPYNGRWVVSPGAFALWPMDRSLGRLATVAGRLDLALEHIAQARKQSQSARATPSLALTSLDEARALQARGGPEDRPRIAQLAREARELAQRIGMGLVVDIATLIEAETDDGATATSYEVTS
jgi:tetratricopeptide (TPR) repeat protein